MKLEKNKDCCIFIGPAAPQVHKYSLHCRCRKTDLALILGPPSAVPSTPYCQLLSKFFGQKSPKIGLPSKKFDPCVKREALIPLHQNDKNFKTKPVTKSS
jgi:hypothetical protein